MVANKSKAENILHDFPSLAASAVAHWALRKNPSPTPASGPEKEPNIAILMVSPVEITGLPGSKLDILSILLTANLALTAIDLIGPIKILNQVSRSQPCAGECLDKYLEEQNLSSTADGRILIRLLYGVLRSQGHLGWLITKLHRGDVTKLEDGVKNVLRTCLSFWKKIR
jgi:hypothetical protein